MTGVTTYTQAIGDEICRLMADEGLSLRKVCLMDGMPDKRTVLRWVESNETFRHQYACACDDREEYWADDVRDIADTASPDEVQQAKLRIDTRKWLMGKLAPKKYGDKVQTEISGPDGSPVEVTSVPYTDLDRAKALAAMLAKTKAKVALS